MAKLLLMLTAVVAVSSWTGGRGIYTVAQLARRTTGGGVPLVFSDDLVKARLVAKEAPACVSRSAVGGDVCEEDPDYDDIIKQHARTLLERDRGVNALLSDPSLRRILNDSMAKPREDPDMIGTRFGGARESPVCSAQETLIYPKRAKTTSDEWVFVLNQEGVQQALRVEKCTSDGSSCGLGMVLPGDAKATCRQKYVYRRLLVLGSNKIEPEEVLMPSCCVCYTTYQPLVTRIANTTGRGGMSPLMPTSPRRSSRAMSRSRRPVRVNFPTYP